MCFITKGSKLRIATKDIECYKFVSMHENHCISLYKDDDNSSKVFLLIFEYH